MSDVKDEEAVAIDYETFYDTKEKYSLSSMPTWQYCADERFDAYLVAICGWEITDDWKFGLPRWPDGSTEWKATEPDTAWIDGAMWRKFPDGRQLYVGHPEKFPDWENLKGRLCLAHNASFDQVVTMELAKRGTIPAFMGDAKWACTADLSTYLMAPRNLKGAMKELFGKEVSKEVRAGMDGRHEWQLDEKERNDLYEYGGSDAVECHDLWLKYSKDWPYVERRVSELNRLSTIRGIRLDIEYVRASVKELESYLAVVACDIPWYPEKALGSLPALKAAVIAMGLTCPKSFKKDDPGFLRWQDQNGNVPFVKARQRAISISMCLARVKSMLETADPADRSHPAFLYFGSHTGRFSGKSESGGNQNLLNLQRKPVMSGDEHVFAGKGVDIRGMYISDPGRSFYVADYAQIEARMSLWLVNDTHMMEALKREGNLYAANAVAMGWCESKSDIKHSNPDLYRLAKCCLTGESLVLVRSMKKSGRGLTRPYYKCIMSVVSTDQVWDGHEWVRQLGAEKMKEVSRDELIEVGGVCLTKDHQVYVDDGTSRRADEVFGDEAAAAVAWSQSQSPVQGWAHVWILATALAGLGARALRLCAGEALRLLAGTLPLHRMWGRDKAIVGQCAEGPDDPVCKMRAPSEPHEGCAECMGEGA